MVAVLIAVAVSAGNAAPPPTLGAKADAVTHKLLEKTCASCHVISQVTAQRKNADQWAGTIDQMIGYGAQLSDADYAKIVDYLAKYHGPEIARPTAK